MTNEQVIEKLIEQVNHNMDTFIGILGIMLAAFLYFQWRLSQTQLNSLKKKIKEEIVEEYSLYEITNIKDINDKLTNLVLANLKNVTNELISKAETYTDNLIIAKSIEMISYLNILKNREVNTAEFIKNIEHVFRMVDIWSSPTNTINEETKMYLYRIFSDLSKKENWQKVKGYDEAIAELKVRVKSLNTFGYIDLDINDHN